MLYETPIPYADYLLVERIGVGGTAEIFRALRRGRTPGEPAVALKRLLPHIAEDMHIVRLLQREVVALQRIDHRNVVQLLDHGTENGLPYLIMELVDGVSLARLLSAAVTGTSRIVPAPIALALISDLAEGLGAAWRHGVVHRDISPTNVQVTAHGAAKILDFGLARVRGMLQTTHGQGLRGKWAYLSPEQIEGLPLDGRSDLFALGSVLYQLLVGRPPFRGSNREETLRKIRTNDFVPFAEATARSVAIALPTAGWMPEIAPSDIQELVHCLLAHDRNDRPGDGDAVSLRLRDMLGDMVSDGHYRQWLAEQVQVAIPAAEIWKGEAAETRGELVTDPVGESVTNIEPWSEGGRALD